MEFLSVLASQQTIADDGVLVHADQTAGLAYAAALGNVGEDRDDLVLRQAGVEEGGAFALGETGLAGLAIE